MRVCILDLNVLSSFKAPNPVSMGYSNYYFTRPQLKESHQLLYSCDGLAAIPVHHGWMLKKLFELCFAPSIVAPVAFVRGVLSALGKASQWTNALVKKSTAWQSSGMVS